MARKEQQQDKVRRKKKKGGGFLTFLIVLLILVGVAVIAYPFVLTQISQVEKDAVVAQLEKELPIHRDETDFEPVDIASMPVVEPPKWTAEEKKNAGNPLGLLESWLDEDTLDNPLNAVGQLIGITKATPIPTLRPIGAAPGGASATWSPEVLAEVPELAALGAQPAARSQPGAQMPGPTPGPTVFQAPPTVRLPDGTQLPPVESSLLLPDGTSVSVDGTIVLSDGTVIAPIFVTPAPSLQPTAGAQPTPAARVTIAPQAMVTAQATLALQATATAQVTLAPQATTTAQATLASQATATAQATAAPQATLPPQATATAQATLAPQATATAQATLAPPATAISAAQATAAPQTAGQPTQEPKAMLSITLPDGTVLPPQEPPITLPGGVVITQEVSTATLPDGTTEAQARSLVELGDGTLVTLPQPVLLPPEAVPQATPAPTQVNPAQGTAPAQSASPTQGGVAGQSQEPQQQGDPSAQTFTPQPGAPVTQDDSPATLPAEEDTADIGSISGVERGQPLLRDAAPVFYEDFDRILEQTNILTAAFGEAYTKAANAARRSGDERRIIEVDDKLTLQSINTQFTAVTNLIGAFQALPSVSLRPVSILDAGGVAHDVQMMEGSVLLLRDMSALGTALEALAKIAPFRASATRDILHQGMDELVLLGDQVLNVLDYMAAHMDQGDIERYVHLRSSGMVGETEAIYLLEMPSIGMKVGCFTNVTFEQMYKSMRKGAALFPRVGAPNANTNITMAAHRTGSSAFFSKFNLVKPNDIILLHTRTLGSFRYIVDNVAVIEQDDWTTTFSVGYPALTLMSCQEYQGVSHGRRIVVRGRLVGIAR
ncbi:MAG: sortase [Oscillospiraceae bacterium]|nr:sortase [Oscillospiraceae bacterium]